MNIIKVPEEWGVLREPPCQESDMFPDPKTYYERFDYTTLFADCIRITDEIIALVGPPLLNLKGKFVITDGTKVLPTQLISQDRCCTLYVKSETDDIYADNGEYRTKLIVTNRSSKFKGLKVIGTNQRDEPITWIEQWVHYHHTVHGIQGFLFYNNYCEVNKGDYLKNHLEKMFPNIVVECVEFSQNLGPRCTQWNSDFGLYVKFEHMKQKYGWCAKMFFNNDVDELLVLYDDIDIDSVYDQIVASNNVGLIYGIQNMDPYNFRLGKSAVDIPRDQIFYKDYAHWGRHINIPQVYGEGSFAKWFLIPERAMNVQWRTHYIGSNQNCFVLDKDPKQILAGHFYAFQNIWKPKGMRNTSTAGEGDLVYDEYLDRLLKKTFS